MISFEQSGSAYRCICLTNEWKGTCTWRNYQSVQIHVQVISLVHRNVFVFKMWKLTEWKGDKEYKHYTSVGVFWGVTPGSVFLQSIKAWHTCTRIKPPWRQGIIIASQRQTQFNSHRLSVSYINMYMQLPQVGTTHVSGKPTSSLTCWSPWQPHPGVPCPLVLYYYGVLTDRNLNTSKDYRQMCVHKYK